MKKSHLSDPADSSREQQLYDETPKHELWNNMKAWGNAFIMASFVAGCALSLALFCGGGVYLTFPGLLIQYVIVLIAGAVFALLIFAVLTFIALHSGPKLPLIQKIITLLLTPAVVILLAALFSYKSA